MISRLADLHGEGSGVFVPSGVDRLPLGAESVTIPLPQFLKSLGAHVRHGGRESLRWCEVVSYRTSDRESDFRFLWVFLYENAYESDKVGAVNWR